MKFSVNWLNEYLSKKLLPQEMTEFLGVRAFEVESVEKKGEDSVVDIKILPNRAFDCLSHFGIARELAAIFDIKFKEPNIKINETESLKIKDFLNVQVLEKKVCPRYSARVVVDVKVTESPKWMQERLIACGLRPINNIVDVTNYVMLETGQPLHVFDLDKLTRSVIPSEARDPDQSSQSAGLLSPQMRGRNDNVAKIIVRRAESNEKIYTLDEQKAIMTLNPDILVIADENQPIAIAGVKGGKTPEVSDQTKRVAIEAANFDWLNIRKTSRALLLRTDASWRFENGLDLNLTVKALDRAAQLMSESAEGKIVSGTIDITSEKRALIPVGVKHSYIENLLGMNFKPAQILQIFKRLEIPSKQIKKGKEFFYELKVPTRRNDLKTSEDIVEEIGRLYGYENIPSRIPSSVLISATKEESLTYEDIMRDVFVGLGFAEVYNYSFISESEKQAYGFQNLAELANPFSQDQKYLRLDLAAGLIKNLKDNLKYFLPGSGFKPQDNAFRFFEIGHVFSQNREQFSENKKVGGLVFLNEGQKKDSAFYELKGVLRNLFEKLGISEYWDDTYIQEGLPSEWKQIFDINKAAQIKSNNKLIGWIGGVNKKIKSELELEFQPAIFELDFGSLVELASEEREYRPPSKYPAIMRDLAVAVEEMTKVEEVLNVIETVGGELLQDTDLFDIYEGLSGSKKSLAFRLIFQSDERNLTDAQVNQLMEKIIKAVEEKGWEVRK
ncbi:MAG: phenylalanine--tRNA ligase subunit beta [Candidatus Portnoybacteria bacterium RBG_13_41_18]|uniref:Phenylalanine--tRNA ligase beta subunit n=1 Tax=Candidatus Portnoybacteria bacterium RBG_13_41_18 TaxID=1801991 RepID=A0A1G2F9P7_9BACT|nr:MAG: phenylalanine--tRNA ligase subunit beta [Candidatus Portnoybacteria bacterium RBG_13_41_18]